MYVCLYQNGKRNTVFDQIEQINVTDNVVLSFIMTYITTGTD